MKKRYIALGIVVAGAGLIYALRAPLFDTFVDVITTDMYVAQDNDAFDSGNAIGQPLPGVRALLDGREVTDLGEFMGPKGLAIFVNRSVDW
jgi:hypothetical protein